jgi:exonuclease SbcC
LKEAEQTTRAAENVLEKLRDFDFGAATATAEEVVRAATAIAAERATVEGQQTALRGQLQAVPSDDDGLDHQGIGAARATLDGLPARATAAENTAARARAEAAKAKAAEQRVGELEEKVQGLDHQLNEHLYTRQDLAATLTDADTKLSDGKNLLGDVRQHAMDAEGLQAQALSKTRQSGLVLQEMAQLQDRDLAGASQQAKTAEEAYANAVRHHSAAAAAHGLNPGDDCLVCNRPLPLDWQPPVAAGLSAAREARQTADAKLTEMQGQIRDLATKAEMISGQATELTQEADQSRETARTAAAHLAALLDRDEIDLTTLPPGDEPLKPIASALAQAREALDVHNAESQQLREKRAVEQANLDNAQDSLEQSSAARSGTMDEAREAERALRTALASLPEQLRVSATVPDDPLGLEEVLLTGLDAAYQVLDARAQELDRRDNRRKHLQQQLNEAADSIRDLDGRWTNQVLSPSDGLIRAVNSHRDKLSEGVTLLNMHDVTLPPAASLSNPAGLVGTVHAFREIADEVTRRTRSMIRAAQMDDQAARQTIAQIATEFTMPATALHPAEPDEVVAYAADRAAEEDAEARAAKRTADDFERLVAPLTRLRQGGEELTLVYKVLKDLSAALKPGAFPKWLTLRRSRALLVHASRLLEQMSGERYAFAELSDENAEWRVVDKDSGLARSPASLSGGEQFIASLALALGMVEMMARSGGRLESLWLDEGFGSLDRTNLDAAIEALASVAARGRMVAVISHVRAVADQVNHVLAVTREVTGSRANWLDPGQRAQLATSDLEGESALAGLLE